MARDIGPDMLEILDEDLANGSISKAQYDAKRIEVVELIRKGKAVELEPLDWAVRIFVFLFGVAWWWFMSYLGAFWFVGFGGFLLCIWAARQVGRARR